MALFALGTCVLMGLTFAGLAIPLLLQRIPPNGWYGFRTRLTRSDPRIWYPVNAWGARRLLWLGAGTLLVAPASLLIPETWLPAYLLAVSGLWVGALVVVLVLGVRYARRLAAALGD
jgi:hypothetical protein